MAKEFTDAYMEMVAGFLTFPLKFPGTAVWRAMKVRLLRLLLFVTDSSSKVCPAEAAGITRAGRLDSTRLRQATSDVLRPTCVRQVCTTVSCCPSLLRMRVVMLQICAGAAVHPQGVGGCSHPLQGGDAVRQGACLPAGLLDAADPYRG